MLGFVVVITFLIGLLYAYFSRYVEKNPFNFAHYSYHDLKELVKNVQLPAMLVDMDQLNKNILAVKIIAKQNNKTVRLATKSLRVPSLIKHVMDLGKPEFQGLMCYCVDEAELLFNMHQFNDILVAYPTVQESEIKKAWDMTLKGVKINLMVDSVEHVCLLENIIKKFGKKGYRLFVCIDLDVAWKPINFLHLGSLRSPCRSLKEFINVFEAIKSSDFLQFNSVMTYEAQFSVADSKPNQLFMNNVGKLLRRFSWPDIYRKRTEVYNYLQKNNIPIQFFNSGGTPTFSISVKDKISNEVTFGSGIFQSYIFDYYKNKITSPAIFFGLRITRKPQPGVITCQSGGFISSGPTSKYSSPIVMLPKGLTYDDNEGFGEVQTPFHVPSNVKVNIGDPVFLRPAKAGEIAERFNSYIIIQDGVVTQEKTYRGLGYCFY